MHLHRYSNTGFSNGGYSNGGYSGPKDYAHAEQDGVPGGGGFDHDPAAETAAQQVTFFFIIVAVRLLLGCTPVNSSTNIDGLLVPSTSARLARRCARE